jgi:valyl-tRNA synthetase
MLVHQNWPTYGLELIDDTATNEISWTITLIDAIRSARAQMNVPAGIKVPLVQVSNNISGSSALAANMAQIKQMARITEVTEAEKNAQRSNYRFGTRRNFWPATSKHHRRSRRESPLGEKPW